MRHWDETEKQILLSFCNKESLPPYPTSNFTLEKEGYAISRYILKKHKVSKLEWKF